MRTYKALLATSIGLGLLLACSGAWAQATRTWVSGVGDDANPCSRTAPCKTFAGAITKTAAGGEINALDPGGFGAVTITKAITIDGRGTLAGVLVSGTNAIVVSAGATEVVTLRGLNLQGLGTGLNGILFNTGAALHVEDVTIQGFVTQAINFQPAVAASLYLKRVTLSNNAVGLTAGMLGAATIARSNFFNNAVALDAKDTAKVAIHESAFVGSSSIAIHSEGTAQVNVDHAIISGNGVGVQADSLVRLSDSMIGFNTTGLAGANVSSFGNNRVKGGNGTDGAPNANLVQQ